MNLQDKVAVITGGASGLGQHTAGYFVRQKGARVVVFDLNEDAGRTTAAALGAENALFCRVDVTDEESVANGVAQAMARFGAIHACINCAGIPAPMKVLDRSNRASNCGKFARTVSVNLVGSFNVMAHCAEQMALNTPDASGERGAIINIASAAAFDGQVGHSAYSASKAGLVGLSLPAARELSGLGIRVNAIAPGLFHTPMADSIDPRIVQSMLSQVEFPRRFGELDEFASLCAFICENAYINAECIRIDAATRLRAR